MKINNGLTLLLTVSFPLWASACSGPANDESTLDKIGKGGRGADGGWTFPDAPDPTKPGNDDSNKCMVIIEIKNGSGEPIKNVAVKVSAVNISEDFEYSVELKKDKTDMNGKIESKHGVPSGSLLRFNITPHGNIPFVSNEYKIKTEDVKDGNCKLTFHLNIREYRTKKPPKCKAKVTVWCYDATIGSNGTLKDCIMKVGQQSFTSNADGFAKGELVAQDGEVIKLEGKHEGNYEIFYGQVTYKYSQDCPTMRINFNLIPKMSTDSYVTSISLGWRNTPVDLDLYLHEFNDISLTREHHTCVLYWEGSHRSTYDHGSKPNETYSKPGSWCKSNFQRTKPYHTKIQKLDQSPNPSDTTIFHVDNRWYGKDSLEYVSWKNRAPYYYLVVVYDYSMQTCRNYPHDKDVCPDGPDGVNHYDIASSHAQINVYDYGRDNALKGMPVMTLDITQNTDYETEDDVPTHWLVGCFGTAHALKSPDDFCTIDKFIHTDIAWSDSGTLVERRKSMIYMNKYPFDRDVNKIANRLTKECSECLKSRSH